MYETQYHRAASVEEAARLMGEAEDGKFLAGGMTLIPTMKQRLASPSDLIDLRRIEALKGIKIDGRTVRIGAVTTHYDVSTNEELAKICPAIANLASHIGDPQVRNMGTIGGSIANNDPAADYPSAILALDATIITNQRSLPASEFLHWPVRNGARARGDRYCRGIYCAGQSRLQEISQIQLRSMRWREFSLPKSGDNISVAVTGAGEGGVFRLKDAETASAGNFSPVGTG